MGMSKIHRIKNYKDLLKVHAFAVHRIKKEASAKATPWKQPRPKSLEVASSFLFLVWSTQGLVISDSPPGTFLPVRASFGGALITYGRYPKPVKQQQVDPRLDGQ